MVNARVTSEELHASAISLCDRQRFAAHLEQLAFLLRQGSCCLSIHALLHDFLVHLQVRNLRLQLVNFLLQVQFTLALLLARVLHALAELGLSSSRVFNHKLCAFFHVGCPETRNLQLDLKISQLALIFLLVVEQPVNLLMKLGYLFVEVDVLGHQTFVGLDAVC